MPPTRSGETQLSAEEALDERFTAMLERVGEAGWLFGGGGPDQVGDKKGEVNIGFVLPTIVRKIIGIEAVAELELLDEEGNLLPGWEIPKVEGGGVLLDGRFTQVELGYTGPVDEDFERVVDAMVKLARPKTDDDVSHKSITPINVTILDWVSASEVKDALTDIPEAELLYNRVVQERADLVKTAIGVTLLDRYEQAAASLERLGVFAAKTELKPIAAEEPEVYLSEEDFAAECRDWKNGDVHLATRLCYRLRQVHERLTYASARLLEEKLSDDERLSLEDGVRTYSRYEGLLNEAGEVSLTRLKTLIDRHVIEPGSIGGVGKGSLELARRVVEAKKPKTT